MISLLEGGEWSAARSGRTLSPGKTRYPLYRRLGELQGRCRQKENLAPTGIFFSTMILYWSRYRRHICKSILSRQTFGIFKSRYLAAGVVASDAPCLTTGSSSLCCFFFFFFFFFFYFFFFFLERCHLPCCSYEDFEVLSALDASTWKSQRWENSSVHQQGFYLGLFRGCSGNCPPVLPGSVSFSDRTCTWIAVRSRHNLGKSGSAQDAI